MSYRSDLKPALRNFSLKINSGEKVGVVGRTGAGKSTLLETLLRLRELDSGRITIDGEEISEWGLQTLRSQISLIP